MMSWWVMSVTNVWWILWSVMAGTWFWPLILQRAIIIANGTFIGWEQNQGHKMDNSFLCDSCHSSFARNPWQSWVVLCKGQTHWCPWCPLTLKSIGEISRSACIPMHAGDIGRILIAINVVEFNDGCCSGFSYLVTLNFVIFPHHVSCLANRDPQIMQRNSWDQ